MLPLELSIKGLGPYVKVAITEEDFKLLHDSRLFLIYGEIGAGKTTIFDAIMFALYGESSFPERNIKDLISHHLKPTDKIILEVDFRFLLGRDTIRVLRRLHLEGSRKEAKLWVNDRIFETTLTQVNERLRRFLRLDAKEFKKVILLPQGEFRDILLAKKDERKVLFEKLFQLERLSLLENYLKERKKEVKQSLENLRNQREECLNSLACESLEALKERIKETQTLLEKANRERKQVKGELTLVERELGLVRDRLKLLEEKKKLTQEHQSLLEKQREIANLEKMVNKLRRFKEVYPYYEDLKRRWKVLREQTAKKRNLKEELIKEETLLRNLERQLEEFQQRGKEIENLRKRVDKLEELREKLLKYDQIKEELGRVEDSLNKKLREVEDLKADRQRLEGLLEKIRTSEELRQWVDLLKDYLKLKWVHLKIEALEIKKVLWEGALSEKRLKLETLRERCFLAKLAERLLPGEPCPLCGSKAHPAKVKLEGEGEVEDKLKELTAEVEKQQEELEDLKKEKAQLEGRRAELVKRCAGVDGKGLLEKIRNLKNILEDKGIPSHLSEEKIRGRIQELERKGQDLNVALQTLHLKKGEFEGSIRALEADLYNLDYDESLTKEAIAAEISKDKGEIEEYDTAWKNLEKEFQDLNLKIKQKQTSLGEIENFLQREVLTYRENLGRVFALKKESLFNTIAELEEIFSKFSELEGYEEEINKYWKERHRIESRLSELEEGLRKDPQFPERSLEDWQGEEKKLKDQVESLREREIFLEREIARHEERLERFKAEAKKVEKLTAEYEKLQKDIGLLETVLKLVTGDNTKRISLQSYATSFCLRRLFLRANYYFKNFSFNRYHFVVEEALKKDLEFFVFDNFSGKAREVRTLSGGESFLATLALALGISDLMQGLAGSTVFQSFFIDEGFGNLDGQTLEQVVQILVELSQKSDRMIGIISHLAELKDRFPVRVEVIKQREGGSKIQVKRVF